MRAGAMCQVRSAKFSAYKNGSENIVPQSTLRTQHLNGFTLLEVMVAMAILAMVLVSLLGLKNRGMQDVVLADQMTTATMLAKRKMTETLITATSGTTALESEDEGEFPEDDFKDYTWKRSISLQEPYPGVSIKEIKVAVLWKEGERQETVELKSYE